MFFAKAKIFVIMICLIVFSCKSEKIGFYDKSIFTYDTQNSPKKYDSYQVPSSRSYQEPYKAPPRAYAPYYDSDSYYVPPSYYNTYRRNTEEGPFDNRNRDINNIQ